jgi:hypothetical protein
VEGFERVVVPQGGHDALRIKFEQRGTITPTDPRVPVFVFTISHTCWWAVDLGRHFKCDSVTESSDGPNYERHSMLKSLTP